MSMLPEILDPCCGGKMAWFKESRNNPLAIFGDMRQGQHILCDGRVFAVRPDFQADFRSLPFPNESFSLVFFDPPHLMRAGKDSWLACKYGVLPQEHWGKDIKEGFAECWRVLKPNGTLIFKWNETQIPIKALRPYFPAYPLFGHTTTNNLKTHWIVFFKTTCEAI